MAVFLIFGRDNTNPDPIKDKRGCYKTGDIVEVLDDSAHDGDLVANPVVDPWYIIKVPGLAVQDVLHAMSMELSDTELDQAGFPVVLTRRVYSLNFNNIPTGARNKLLADRYLEVNTAQARNYIRDKRNNASL